MKKLRWFIVVSLVFILPSLASSASNIPFFRKYKCFWEARNEKLSMCRNYYHTLCDESLLPFPAISEAPLPTVMTSEGKKSSGSRLLSSTRCPKVLVCPKFTNPVFDAKGTFYPSACWAEHLGVTDYTYGISERTRNFISNLWKEHGYEVPKPSLEFSYNGSGIQNWKNGVFARSTVWKDPHTFVTLDFNIHTDQNPIFSSSISELSFMHPPFGRRRALLVFVPFDEIYPEKLLLTLTPRYVRTMNHYLKKKQQVKNPVQFDVMPVVIAPPSGLSPLTTYLSLEELEAVYRAATQKAGKDNFDTFIYVPVARRVAGGYYGSFKEKDFVSASLRVHWEYSTEDTELGIRSLWHIQDAFITISHELLHALGLSGDHFPMGEGTFYLDFVGGNVDKVTGKSSQDDYTIWPFGDQYECDFYGRSPDYYMVELPRNLKIYVGKEPDWAMRTESKSGPCIAPNGRSGGEMLKDLDGDGDYDLIYKNNLIGEDLQKILGWVDVDGDGISELDDPNPYGGMKVLRK